MSEDSKVVEPMKTLEERSEANAFYLTVRRSSEIKVSETGKQITEIYPNTSSLRVRLSSQMVSKHEQEVPLGRDHVLGLKQLNIVCTK